MCTEIEICVMIGGIEEKKGVHMSYKKQSAVCGIISCLILVAVLFAVGYCVLRGVSRQDTPFDLSPDFISLKAPETGRAKTEAVMDVEEDSNITLISQYEGEEYMGIYDPAYYFYKEKAVDFFGELRYFSREDYEEKKSVGVYVSDQHNVMTGYSEMESAVTPMVEELLFSVNPSSSLYKENVTYIANQMCLEELGDQVFIDSEVRKARNHIKEKLLEAGYRIEDSGYNGLFNAFLDRLAKGGLYTKVVLVPALALYPFFSSPYLCFLRTMRER